MEKGQIRKLTLKQAKQLIEAIYDWQNDSFAYLAESTPYAQGYKAGVAQCHSVVSAILSNHLNTKSK
jgi:catabolite regulation protein CreA